MAARREASSGGSEKERGCAAIRAQSRGGARGMLPRTQVHGRQWPWCHMSRATCAQNKKDAAGSSADTEVLEHPFGSGRSG